MLKELCYGTKKPCNLPRPFFYKHQLHCLGLEFVLVASCECSSSWEAACVLSEPLTQHWQKQRLKQEQQQQQQQDELQTEEFAAVS